MGFVRGELLVVWSNDLLIEVRTERGDVRLTAGENTDRQNDLLVDPLIVGDCLVVGNEHYRVNVGLTAWDIPSGRQLIHERFVTDGYAFFFTPIENSNVLLASVAEGIAFWEFSPTKCRIRRVVEAQAVEAAAFHPATRRLAYYRHDVIRIVHPWGEIVEYGARLTYCTGIAWGLNGQVLIVLHPDIGFIVLVPNTGASHRGVPLIGEMLCQSDCGRWIAFHRGLVDLETMSTLPHCAHAACFDRSTRSFVLADEYKVWRVPV